MVHCKTKVQMANVRTKPLSKGSFEELKESGVTNQSELRRCVEK